MIMAGEKERLDRIRLAVLETILEESPEEQHQALLEQGDDPALVVDEQQKLIATAIATSRRRQLSDARDAWDLERQSRQVFQLPSSPAARKAELDRIMKSSSAPQTLAARSDNGQEMSDAEVTSLLQDLLELGFAEHKNKV